MASPVARIARLGTVVLVAGACLPGGAQALDPPGLPKLPEWLSLPQLPDLKVPALPPLPPLPTLVGAPASPSSPPARQSPAAAPAPEAGPSSPPAAQMATVPRRSVGRATTRSTPVAGRPTRRPADTPAGPAAPAGSATRRAAAPSGVKAAGSPILAGPSRPGGNPLGAIGRLLPLPVPDWSKPIILGLLVLAAALAIRTRLATVRAHRLEAARADLVEDRDAMQRALVPALPPRLGRLAVSVAYRPAEGPAAGGDFYDAFPVAGARVGLVLGDASGHGREALARSALMRYTLRAYVEAGLEPRAALALAGKVLSGQTAEDFTTVAVGVYEDGAGTLTYALAGHPPPILVGPTAHDPVTVCSSPAIGWGVPTGRRQTTVGLPAGALACFFSDGLTESRSQGRMLGREGLEAMLSGLGSGASAAALLARVGACAEGAADDMAACIVAPDPPRRGAARRVEEIELDARHLEQVRRSASCRHAGCRRTRSGRRFRSRVASPRIAALPCCTCGCCPLRPT